MDFNQENGHGAMLPAYMPSSAMWPATAAAVTSTAALPAGVAPHTYFSSPTTLTVQYLPQTDPVHTVPAHQISNQSRGPGPGAPHFFRDEVIQVISSQYSLPFLASNPPAGPPHPHHSLASSREDQYNNRSFTQRFESFVSQIPMNHENGLVHSYLTSALKTPVSNSPNLAELDPNIASPHGMPGYPVSSCKSPSIPIFLPDNTHDVDFTHGSGYPVLNCQPVNQPWCSMDPPMQSHTPGHQGVLVYPGPSIEQTKSEAERLGCLYPTQLRLRLDPSQSYSQGQSVLFPNYAQVQPGSSQPYSKVPPGSIRPISQMPSHPYSQPQNKSSQPYSQIQTGSIQPMSQVQTGSSQFYAQFQTGSHQSHVQHQNKSNQPYSQHQSGSHQPYSHNHSGSNQPISQLPPGYSQPCSQLQTVAIQSISQIQTRTFSPYSYKQSGSAQPISQLQTRSILPISQLQTGSSQSMSQLQTGSIQPIAQLQTGSSKPYSQVQPVSSKPFCNSSNPSRSPAVCPEYNLRPASSGLVSTDGNDTQVPVNEPVNLNEEEDSEPSEEGSEEELTSENNSEIEDGSAESLKSEHELDPSSNQSQILIEKCQPLISSNVALNPEGFSTYQPQEMFGEVRFAHPIYPSFAVGGSGPQYGAVASLHPSEDEIATSLHPSEDEVATSFHTSKDETATSLHPGSCNPSENETTTSLHRNSDIPDLRQQFLSTQMLPLPGQLVVLPPLTEDRSIQTLQLLTPAVQGGYSVQTIVLPILKLNRPPSSLQPSAEPAPVEASEKNQPITEPGSGRISMADSEMKKETEILDKSLVDPLVISSEDDGLFLNQVDETGLPKIMQGIDLDRVKQFAADFKSVRLSLGLTQAQVGLALQTAVGAGTIVSQSTICRFEKLEITALQVKRLLPTLQAWLTKVKEKKRMGVPIDLDSVLQSSEGQDTKRRKKRTVFSDSTVTSLNQEFVQDQNPSSARLQDIAAKVRLEKETVRIWFSNRRQTERKFAKE